jgi:hypothetical protein
VKVGDIRAAIKDLPDDQDVVVYAGLAEFCRGDQRMECHVTPVKLAFAASLVAEGKVSIQPVDGHSSVLVILPAQEITPLKISIPGFKLNKGYNYGL